MPAQLLAPDQFPLPEASPHADEHALLSALLEEAPSYIERVNELMRGRQLLRRDPVQNVALCSAALERAEHLRGLGGAGPGSARARAWLARTLDLVRQLAPRSAPADAASAARMLGLAASLPAPRDRQSPRAAHFVPALQAFMRAAELEPGQLDAQPELRAAGEQLLEVLRQHAASDPLQIGPYRALEALLGVHADRLLAPGEHWADALLAELAAMDEQARAPWAELITHCKGAESSKPTKRWLEQTRALTAAIGREPLREALLRWLPQVAKGRSQPLPPEQRGYNVPDDPGYIIEAHQTVLRGLAWAASELPDAALARTLSALARACFRKLRGHGPRAPKVGNAALWALGTMRCVEAVGQLAVLEALLSGKAVKKQIARSLAIAAEREGLSPAELEELAVPTHDLREVGRSVEQLGDYQALLEVVDSATVRLRWREGDAGKLRLNPPAALKREFPDQVKLLRARVKDISALLGGRRDRLELHYRDEQVWSYPKWRARYLEHPLVGSLARRLIWRLREGERSVDLLWRSPRGLAQLGGEPPPAWISEQTQVSLWHPLEQDADAILVWRDLLESQGLTQPFKQAHRETYAPDAQERAAGFSVRLGGRILRQHAFNALCQTRGWQNRLRLSVDDAYAPATLPLPRHGLRAELWIEGVGAYGTDTTEVGTYLYVLSEQLRFHRLDDPPSLAHALRGGYRQPVEPVPFSQVPARVFSEVMRDVDLFCSVSSVESDPNFDPSSCSEPLASYWQEFAFGPLSATGRTRRATLGRLLPSLPIADQCTLGERCLEVRDREGVRYEIHLGTGHVRDEAGAMVRVAAERRKHDSAPALPFEGDPTLALILTRAAALGDAGSRRA